MDHHEQTDTELMRLDANQPSASDQGGQEASASFEGPQVIRVPWFIFERVKECRLVSQTQVDAFVQLVLDGEQDKADEMLQADPGLSLDKGSGKEKSGREWKGITGFQFALWALDWRMWVMIRGHMEKAGYTDHVKRQFDQQERLSIKQGHGAHFDFGPLLKAYDQYKVYVDQNKWDECDRCFVKEIGGAQRLLPVHVAENIVDRYRLHEYVGRTRPSTFHMIRWGQLEAGVWDLSRWRTAKLGALQTEFVAVASSSMAP